MADLQVSLLHTRILEFHMSAPPTALNNPTYNAQLGINVNFNVEHLDETTSRIQFALALHPQENGSYYIIETISATTFQFPEDTSEEDREEYLKTDGVMRAVDSTRTAIRSITALGAYGPADIPAINVVME